MKKYLITCSFAVSVCINVTGLRYNVGLYKSAVETVCSRLSNGLIFEEREIKHELNFVDNRTIAPVLGIKYGKEEEFEKLLAISLSDHELSGFATSCKAVFMQGNDEIKATVHFLLDGVLDFYSKSRKSCKEVHNSDVQYFDDGRVASFLKMFHLDKISA